MTTSFLIASLSDHKWMNEWVSERMSEWMNGWVSERGLRPSNTKKSYIRTGKAKVEETQEKNEIQLKYFYNKLKNKQKLVLSPLKDEFKKLKTKGWSM